MTTGSLIPIWRSRECFLPTDKLSFSMSRDFEEFSSADNKHELSLNTARQVMPGGLDSALSPPLPGLSSRSEKPEWVR